MRRILLVCTVLFCIVGLAACGDTLCLTDGRYGILLSVQDSVTGGRVTSDRATAIATASKPDFFPRRPYADTLVRSPAGIFRLALGRAGRYDVAVEASGYLPWAQEDVRVTAEGECRVQTVELLALLQPE